MLQAFGISYLGLYSGDKEGWVNCYVLLEDRIFILLASCTISICCVSVLVVPDPSFDSPEVNVTVVEDQSVVLPCLVDNLAHYKVQHVLTVDAMV